MNLFGLLCSTAGLSDRIRTENANENCQEGQKNTFFFVFFVKLVLLTLQIG